MPEVRLDPISITYPSSDTQPFQEVIILLHIVYYFYIPMDKINQSYVMINHNITINKVIWQHWIATESLDLDSIL